MRLSLEAVKPCLSEPTPAPLAGQQALDVATVHDHHYEGAGGPCAAETFGVPCRGPYDAHRPKG